MPHKKEIGLPTPRSTIDKHPSAAPHCALSIFTFEIPENGSTEGHHLFKTIISHGCTRTSFAKGSMEEGSPWIRRDGQQPQTRQFIPPLNTDSKRPNAYLLQNRTIRELTYHYSHIIAYRLIYHIQTSYPLDPMPNTVDHAGQPILSRLYPVLVEV